MIVIGCLILILKVYFSAAQGSGYECCYSSRIVKEIFRANETEYQLYVMQKRWPSNVVYYDVDPHMDPRIRRCVAKAVDYFNSNNYTCLRWMQRLPDRSEDPKKHWVTFFQARDAYNAQIFEAAVGWNVDVLNTFIYIGYWSGIEYLKLILKPHQLIADKKDELSLVTSIMHEMMHTMGFRHEHQRGDRDCWVYVDPDMIRQYYIDVGVDSSWRGSHSAKFPYDLSSVMHYEQTPQFYAHDGSQLGRVDGTLSPLDFQKINYVYCGQPAYCDIHNQCDLDLEEYRVNPRCFREGVEYYSPTTCKPCQRSTPAQP